jgi:uncharacterized protein YdaL
MPPGYAQNTTRRRVRKRLPLLAAAAACLILLAGIAGSMADAPAAAVGKKPGKPAKAQPSKEGLVAALGMKLAISESAPVGIAPPREGPATAAAAAATGNGIPNSVGASTLVLYDTSGPYGWLGELYAIATANLASHFGSWTAQPVAEYKAGQIAQFTATIYLGSTYDEPLPAAFLADVFAATKPVIWVYDNIWALTNAYPDFQQKYGWMWSQFDLSRVAKVVYRNVELTRDAVNNGAGIMAYATVEPATAQVLALAKRDDGSTFPWAIRSGTLTYVGEIPFAYVSETDRLLAFEDILFDALDPSAATRHRALLRLEDLSPETDAAEVRQVVDYLYAQGVPFGFGVSPYYRDPLAVENPQPTSTHLSGSEIASLVAYMRARGGTQVMHGYTHQYSNVRNPYTAVTGDDYEFYRATENPDHTVVLQGPVAEDSTAWALGRIDSSSQEFRTAGLAVPQIFELPHYAASAVDYAAVGQRFGVRWERALYFGGGLRGGMADYGRVIGQLYPYVVRDLYGTVVLPENLGNYEPEPFYAYPARSVADILDAAAKHRVVRDGFASVYYHPWYGVTALSQIVAGMRSQGWTFVSPASVANISEGRPPVNTAPPTITGSAYYRETLTASTGSWDADPPATYAYQWLRCSSSGGSCVSINKATKATYVVVRADVGRTLRVTVTATNPSGSAGATSAQTAVVQLRRR